jgi:hypothetical protein
MFLPVAPAAAQAPVPSSTKREAPTSAPAVVDVALHEAGKLHGVVVDAQGLPMSGTDVAVVQSGKIVARSVTDASGKFVTGDLRGGVYQIAAGMGVTTVRVWEATTAPPIARPAAMVVGSPAVVRGQRKFGSLVFSDAIVLGAVVAAAIAIPIIISNSGDDDPDGS